MPSHRVGLAAFAWVLALTACAIPSIPPERSYSGRFSATALGGPPGNAVSGRFTIEVWDRRQVIDLATPVGTTIARIEIEPGKAVATGPQLQSATGPDADALVESLLGWRLPVSGLASWIDGRPEPSRPARTQRDGDRIITIEQDGWTIRIDEYSGATSKPRRLSMERPVSGSQPAVSVRLIVDDPAG